MQIEFPDNIGVTETEARLELAVALYARRKISLGRAAELAGIGHLELQQALAERDVHLHYGVEDLDQDIAALQRLRHF